jgi:nucleotide-binding universal stress UspA family protein
MSREMFETILIPVDGSQYAERAARRGFEIASAFGSHVHLVCVADTGPLANYQLPGEHESAAEAITGRAEAVVEELRTRAPEGIEVTTATPTGSAKTEIVEYGDSIDADLIVMGSRGRGGVERLMLGSVTEHVVRVSDIDVLVHGGGD